MYMAFVLVSFYILLSTNEIAFSVMAFFMPFANIFKTSVNSTSLFTILTIILVVKLLFTCKVFRVPFFMVWLYLFAVQIFGCAGNIPILIKQALILLLIYGYFNSCKRIPKELMVNLSLGLIISCFIANFSKLIPGLSIYMSSIKAYEISSDVLRFTGLYSDPNYLSLVLIISCISLLIMVKTKMLEKRYLILCAFLVYFGLFTISKSFYIMLVIVSVFYLILSIKRRQYGATLLFVFFAIIVIVFLIKSNPVLFDYFIKRLFYSTDITTGRTEIWKQYISYFVSNPFQLIFGSGISASKFTTVAHNTYIDFLYYYGIVNTFVFFLGVYLALKGHIIKFRLQNLIPLICLIIMSFALSCLQMYDFAFLLIFILEFLTESEGIVNNKYILER